MTPARKKAMELVGSCTCHEGYTSRKLRDPSCAWCEHGAAVEEVVGERDKLQARYDRLLAAEEGAVDILEDEAIPARVAIAMSVLRDAIREAEEVKE